jgi:hypothetical protein
MTSLYCHDQRVPARIRPRLHQLDGLVDITEVGGMNERPV